MSWKSSRLKSKSNDELEELFVDDVDDDVDVDVDSAMLY